MTDPSLRCSARVVTITPAARHLDSREREALMQAP
jgi:hypothetical protein